MPTPSQQNAWQKLFARRRKDDGIEDMNSILLQIVLAVMLIFMIAFFLFMGKVDGEISQLDELHQKIEQAERTELLHAVDQVTQNCRIRYGLTEFLHIDPATGEKTFDFSDVISRGKAVAATPQERAFRIGATAAYRDYRSQESCEAQWMREIRRLAPDLVDRHFAWLREIVKERIASVKKEVLEVQSLAAAAIQQHYAQHPDEVSDPEVKELLAQLKTMPETPERAALIAELARRLQVLAYAHLAEICKIPLLDGRNER